MNPIQRRHHQINDAQHLQALDADRISNQWQDLASPYHETRMEPDPDHKGKMIPVKRVNNPEALLANVDKALAQGRQLTIGSDDHAMLLLGKETRQGKPVYIVSSWSGRYKMRPEALKQRLTNVLTNPL